MSQEFANQKLTLLIVATIALFLIAGQSNPAQTPDTFQESAEVKQLKERLQQLEQVVVELKGKLATVEDAQKAAKTINTVGEAKPVQVVEAEVKDDAILRPPETAGKEDDKKSGGTFEVYGFAMLDAGYQFGQTTRITLT